MFDKKTYKKIIILILALTMIFGTVVLAAEGIYKQKLTASYGRIKFNYEGRDITDEIGRKYGTPAFTVDGRAYAPVRSLADLLDIDIDYDQEGDIVKITDPIVEAYEKKLNEKDKEIIKFRRELNKLKGIDGEDYVNEGSYYDYSDNEKDVKKEVENRFGTIKIFDAILYRLDYTSKTAFFEIKFSNKYKEEWEDLDQEEIEELLGFIAEKIELDNEHIERIYGEIWMGVLPVGKYKKDIKESTNKEDFTRYSLEDFSYNNIN